MSLNLDLNRCMLVSEDTICVVSYHLDENQTECYDIRDQEVCVVMSLHITKYTTCIYISRMQGTPETQGS